MKHLKLFENKYENKPIDFEEWEQPIKGKNSSTQPISWTYGILNLRN